MDNTGLVGDGELTGGEAQTKPDENKKLTIYLIILAICAIGLVIGVVSVRLMGGEGGNGDTTGGCVNKNSIEDIQDCLSLVFAEQGLDETVEEYGGVIDKAYNDRNEGLFYQLLAERSVFLASQGKCIKAVDLLGDSRVSELQDGSDKGIFYSRAVGVSDSCGDTKVAESYQNKLMEVHERGGDF